MKHAVKIWSAVLLGVCTWGSLLAAEGSNSQGSPAQPPGKKIRVLVTYGGHGFDEKEFWAMFDAIADITWAKAELPKQADILKPGLEKQYDVLVMYDMCQKLTPEQQQAFVDLLKRGIGVVSLHHNLGAYFEWEEFQKIIGGRFCLRDIVIDGKPYKQSAAIHGQNLRVLVADKTHPITQGVNDFDIHDEVYGPFYTAKGIHVLLRTEHPQNNPIIAWTHCYHESPVFYLMLGHDRYAYQNPNFHKLLAQGIRWAAAELGPKK